MELRQYILEFFLSEFTPVAKIAGKVAFKNPVAKAAPSYMDKLKKAQNAKATMGMKASGAL